MSATQAATQLNDALLLLIQQKFDAATFKELLEKTLKAPCTRKLGTGAYGTVYKVCTVLRAAAGETCLDCLAIKIVLHNRTYVLPNEFETQLRAWQTLEGSSFQFLMPRPFFFHENALFMQLKDDFEPAVEVEDRVVPVGALQLKAYMWQLLNMFARIRSVYPSFMHNDLHTGNVLFSKSPLPYRFVGEREARLYDLGLKSVAILDFGLANLAPPVGKTPTIKKNEFGSVFKEHDDEGLDVRINEPLSLCFEFAEDKIAYLRLMLEFLSGEVTRLGVTTPSALAGFVTSAMAWIQQNRYVNDIAFGANIVGLPKSSIVVSEFKEGYAAGQKMVAPSYAEMCTHPYFNDLLAP